MGPFRGGLIALFAMAMPAAAEVCNMVRPNWSPESGPATAITEAMKLLMAPWPILTIAVIVLAHFVRKPILGHIALALAISLVAVLAVLPLLAPNEVAIAAQAEGCVGPNYLRYVVAVLILGAAALVMWRNTQHEKTADATKE